MTRKHLTQPIIPPVPEVWGDPPVRFWRVQDRQYTPPDHLNPRDGATFIASRARFEALAHRDDVPGALGVREVKFIITGMDTSDPRIFFADTKRHDLHYHFARDILGVEMGIGEFNRHAYFNENRAFVVGSVLAHDSYVGADGQQGHYAVTFWPSDIIRFQTAEVTMRLVTRAMPFAADRLAYNPGGAGQYQVYLREQAHYAAAGLQVVTSDEIFAQVSYAALNLGVAFGRLLDVGPDGPRPTARDIPVFRTLPNDLARVAGVISTTPQTPLSHVNLRAQQNEIPNAYVRDGAETLSEFMGQIVRLEVTADSLDIRLAQPDEMEAHLNALRPARVQLPIRDLSRTEVMPLSDLRHGDHVFFGAKAANVAELRHALDPDHVPDGFAVPYAFFDAFMLANDLYAAAQRMMAAPGFVDDPEVRRDMLKAHRRAIRAGEMPLDLRDALGDMQSAFPPGTTPRCRSSANAEDLAGFTGAGLYNSYTHREDEGHIEKSIKQVWASLWTYRAYEERAFYRVDHMACAMGVLVHPNFDDEQVNGVAITHNPYFTSFDGYYINVQIGEDRVTNPEGDVIAEELLVMSNAGLQTIHPFVTMRIRESNLVPAGGSVLSVLQVARLVEMMEAIQAHFRVVYAAGANADFAMEIEFKVDVAGVLIVKQARPWVV